MKRIVTLIILLAFSLLSFAQNQKTYPLHLKNISLTPVASDIQGLESFAGYHFTLVQHPQIQLQKNFLGFHTFAYLPSHTAIAAVRSVELAQAHQKLTAQGGALVAWQPDWKLSPRLYHQDYPDWAWVDGDKLKVWLRYYPQLAVSDVLNDLNAKGWPVIDRSDNEHLVALAFEPEHIGKLAALPYVYYVQEMEEPGVPENFAARASHRVNTLQAPLGLHIDGSGITVGVGDDGDIGPHIDYKGRLTQGPGTRNSPAGSDHGDHVAGTVFGAGNLDPRGRGMAPGARNYYQDYPDNLRDADQNYLNHSVRITNSSYSNGCNAGYTIFTNQMDQDAFDNPEMLHVFSAGNSNGSNCGYGAGSQWGNVTGGHKIAKNVIAVANITSGDAIARSSSRGPASDGRIKPDVAAVGSQVYSTTTANGPNGYNVKTGTSMSAPGVAGVLAVLYDAYARKNGENPQNTLMKNILMNTADDLGTRGPDFIFGYGRVNARAAYQVIQDQSYHHDSLTSATDSVTLVVQLPPNLAQVRIMLQWRDPAAAVIASTALVNDLDLTVNAASTAYQPWVLDHRANSSTLGNAAIRARDSLNNMEQVTIDNPTADSLIITVAAHNLPSGSVPFYLSYYFEDKAPVLTYPAAGEPLTAGTREDIRWDAPVNHSNTFHVQYSTDGSQWLTVTNNRPATARSYSWFVPTTLADGTVYMRIISGSDTTASTEFPVMQKATNLRIISSCPDSVQISWDSIPGVDGYIVYKLGAMYMDSLTYTTQPEVTLSEPLGPEQWYSVSGAIAGRSGMRARAINRDANATFNCQLETDLAIESSAPAGRVANCFDISAQEVSLIVRNLGRDTINSFTAGYRLNTGSFTTQMFNDTLLPGGQLSIRFDSTVAFAPLSINTLQFFVSLNQDQNVYNDSLSSTVQVFNSNAVTAPYEEDFEGMAPCGTAPDCGATRCFLSQGWFNLSSGDDVDFRVNRGPTASSNTGPIADFMPGSSSGNYVYTEASGGCDSALAVMLSPCLDLQNAVKPFATMAYHMLGSDMGWLRVDLFDGDTWIENIVPPVIGNQGSLWQELTVDLEPYNGKTVQLRFRGKTGSGFTSDIALDGFQFKDTLANFSLTDASALENIRVFPNPTQGSFKVAMAGQSPGHYDFQITDLSGKEVERSRRTLQAQQRTFTFDLKALPTGVYFLKISGERETVTRKIILQ